MTNSSDIVAISQQLRLCAVFGANSESLSQQARIKALQSGIDLTLIPDTLSFNNLFDTDELAITVDGVIKDTYAGRIITSPKQVIRRLATRSIEDEQPAIGQNEQLNYPRLEALFMAHLRRYILSGDGPTHARNIVELITGHEYLPVAPLGALMVCTYL